MIWLITTLGSMLSLGGVELLAKGRYGAGVIFVLVGGSMLGMAFDNITGIIIWE